MRTPALRTSALISGPRPARRGILLYPLCAFAALTAYPPASGAGAIDLARAVVVAPAGLNAVEQRAATMLIEEVEKRTQIRWERRTTWPESNATVVAIGPDRLLDEVAGRHAAGLRKTPQPAGAEGFRLQTVDGASPPAVLMIGNDARGVMFGVGRLLRELELSRGRATLRSDLTVSTAPKQRLRGHQLGYRPKTHSYDAWDLPVWEQYYRDLIVFGCNAVELIPPRSDDDADSPHFPRPPMAMMVEMSRLADAYGLDVWVWYPAMDPDYGNPATVDFALREWGEVLRQLPRLDAVFVPGGDPGHTQPRHLMAMLAKQAAQLKKFHPKAGMWVSPQGFDQVWMDEFLEILRTQSPDWLTGLVFGPQVRVSADRLRELAPARYPIRHYPDITHSRQCEYPVPDWDIAYALTEARECINPRPLDETAIFRASAASTIGFITYSEGCNDDVNKALWSALGWDPQARPIDVLRDYGRYFIGAAAADGFAQGLLALERNWRGSLLANTEVETTLQQFQAMERNAQPRDRLNWRFQQALFRAYYDAYTRRRLIHEMQVERHAMEELRTAPGRGARTAMTAAERILDEGAATRVADELRLRVHELGEALFQSIRMQLSVEKHHAIAIDRGAALDTLDYPLNNAPWLKAQFARARALPSEPERLRALTTIVEWENPGPGGFYDDLGNPARQPHLVRGPGFQRDPGAWHSPRSDSEEDLVVDDPSEKPDVPRRVSWMDHAEVLYDGVLQMRYTELDPAARYKVRVVYAGDNLKKPIRLTAGSGLEVHPLLKRPFPFRPLEFDVPTAATADGSLTLSWTTEPGQGGNGRGCQVSEVWLMRK